MLTPHSLPGEQQALFSVTSFGSNRPSLASAGWALRCRLSPASTERRLGTGNPGQCFRTSDGEKAQGLGAGTPRICHAPFRKTRQLHAARDINR
ncbi:hypothetical protein SKAU_G00122500 [Synaphobranchus kaupii]|uniref:Uncharacterized protein n=1 Tax=Synaphobranchus kaupii TaxID=118154 RepID=A0A9Q1FP59_SYNKA|nr:hypothetical protein SKAU_G00122500 [Synaphobranchus kaupii]